MEIIRIPVLTTNYSFLLYDPTTRLAAAIDPAVAEPIMAEVDRLQANLVAIFNTHHDLDHVGGNSKLLAKYPHISIYGSEADRGRIPGQKVFLNDGDKVEFSGRYADVFFLPGHTLGHIAYYFPPQKDRDFGELFSGDVIFGSGCGRIKEGTPAQMVESMGKLRQLPDNTRIWCAHEYTLNNLEFSLTIEPENQDLQARYRETKIARSRHEPTVPLLLEIEKRTNPFLRWDVPSVQEAVSQTDPARVFGRLRGKKDLF